MSLYDQIKETELSCEVSPFHQAKLASAMEKEARNAEDKGGHGYDPDFKEKQMKKMDDKASSEEEKKAQKEAAKLERKENRKEALREIGDGLIEAAKATGKGVKETARLAYNLALGKNKKFD